MARQDDKKESLIFTKPFYDTIMNNNQRHSVELKLLCAKNALRFVKQLAAVKEADKSIDEAIVELFADRSYDYEPPVKKPIHLHSAEELLAELKNRLASRGAPAMA